MKIGAVSTDWALADSFGGVTFRQTPRLGGTGSMRLQIPGTELARHGHTFVSVPLQGLSSAENGYFIVTEADGTKHFDCDVIWLQRWMSSSAPEAIKRARACGQIVINDLDDWFWGLPTTNIAWHSTHKRNNADFNRDHYLETLRVSSGITVSTNYLAERLKNMGVPVFVCRNALDLPNWPVLDATDTGTVGWVGGIPWRGSDLAVLRGILGPFLERHGLAFYHGGEAAMPCPTCTERLHPSTGCETCNGEGKVRNPQVPTAIEQLGIDPKKVECSSRFISDFVDYPALWEPIDILVAPLEESPFNRSKSSLKPLEGSACGLGVIGVAWHEEYQWWAEQSAVRLARNAKDWMRHLEALVDPVTRKEEGAINRAAAENQSIGVQWPVWEKAFQAIKDAA